MPTLKTHSPILCPIHPIIYPSFSSLDKDIRYANEPSEHEDDLKEEEELEDPSESKEQSRTDRTYRIEVTEYTNPFDLDGDCSGADDLRSISKHNWLRVSRDEFILCIRALTISVCVAKDSSTGGMYDIRVRKRLNALSPTAPLSLGSRRRFGYTRYRDLEDVENPHRFVDAIRLADAYVEREFGIALKSLTHWKAAWRRKPMTTSQQAELRKHGVQVERSFMTQGQAANMITRAYQGGLTYWKTMQRTKALEEKSSEKEKALRQRTLVQVGPI